jgi:hypothetical protein
MLAMVRQGLADMAESKHDRVLLGFCGVVVFGRSVTNAMQNLRSFDEKAFNDWYGPWEAEMRADPLLRYFYELRTQILKGIAPQIGILLAGFGPSVPRPGSISIEGKPLPEMHLGKPIADTSMENLCRLYSIYLERMHTSLGTVVWEIQDRYGPPWGLPPR